MNCLHEKIKTYLYLSKFLINYKKILNYLNLKIFIFHKFINSLVYFQNLAFLILINLCFIIIFVISIIHLYQYLELMFYLVSFIMMNYNLSIFQFTDLTNHQIFSFFIKFIFLENILLTINHHLNIIYPVDC
jgi:hypothetical protein